MSRYFRNQKIELLAPCGNFEIFKEVVKTGADALYFGGKILNMRMHRKNFNFSNEEIIEATKIAHDYNKKVYITVNNLFSQEDLSELKEFLLFLNDANIDGIIIQDMSIIPLINKLNSNYEIHSSVMMNVHNLESINELYDLGVSRIVASRESSLADIKELRRKTDMDFEYFTHGDMCVTHGAQCLYSGMTFGKSSNRGLCMKPCRWDFKTKHNGYIYPTEYPLAVKDLSMFEHIPEMIDAGIVSFKIEGRMRESDYLINLINLYSDSIDRYIADPDNYNRTIGADYLFENRKRDLSTAFAFGNQGLENINRRYEGTGKFYSHGKVFSNPIEEREVTNERISEIKDVVNSNVSESTCLPALSVKVNCKEHALIAINKDVSTVYLSGEVFQPSKDFTVSAVVDILNHKKNTKIVLGTPRMCSDKDLDRIEEFIKEVNQQTDIKLDGILVTSLGSLTRFKNLGISLIGDTALNIYNHEALEFYSDHGLNTGTISLETPLLDLIGLVSKTPIETEILVAGAPTVMYLEHDLYLNTNKDEIINTESLEKEDNKFEKNETMVLVDDLGFEHPVFRDNYGRNHLTTYKELCYLPILKELRNIGINSFRIEGCHYDDKQLTHIIDTYKKAIDCTLELSADQLNLLYANIKTIRAGITLGSLDFN